MNYVELDNLKYSMGDKKLSNGDKVTVYGTFGGINSEHAVNIKYAYAE